MTRIVAVVGMPGSGKGVLSRIAIDAGIPVFAMGDIVRSALQQAGLEETPENVGATALSIRTRHGEAFVAERMLERLSDQAAPLVIIEGVRQPEEMEVFRNAFGAEFSILAILSDETTRVERVIARGRGEDGDAEAFRAREARESAWGLPDLIAGADHSLHNDTDLATFESRCAAWLGAA